MRRLISCFAGLLALTACGESAELPVTQGMGTDPALPEPTETVFPTVNTADAVGWGDGEAPRAAPGLTVSAFASDLDHPRWLYRLPNGDVLVAESNKPPKGQGGGLMAWIEEKVMASAGAGAETANRITLLRDSDRDGQVDERHVFATADNGLASPFGMALVAGDFYVANYAGLLRFPYEDGATSLRGEGELVAEFPDRGEKAGHWTRNLLASPDGRKLYVSVGSVSNVGESGLGVEEGRAAIHEFDVETGEMRLFATGLRNPVGMDWNPATGELWTAVNERDALGSDLVPDYMTSVEEGGFYGWPWLYYGNVADDRAPGTPPRETAIKPDYALGPHTASLGLAFTSSGSGAIVGQHGSWNRKPPSGYMVVYVPFEDGEPAGLPQVLLDGFLVGGEAKGRPVGVAFDATGALLVADDAGNRVWRVAPEGR
ncbi:sorbosone dehydrogenase [Pacificimonas flava]|uniref:Sorbosone dehydrogenase n=2 Tax=Pacificimonas TaxID=1960290 RepID=A0A219B2V7_9SPHN|nr:MULTISPECIES: sorbosone dehydrogenase family protein [Pacificimonas]MBZ6377679.1 sorbosone dehydrogenase family protein [Pacificimonas aurantium]OWV32641.1 sorbosone dehydrogenase [Pacificimonas flava]